MSTETLHTRPRVHYACDEITRLATEMGPNAHLPTMVQLRESLGVSMNTLHAALRELESLQVVRSVHGVGIFVSEPQKLVLTAGGGHYRGAKLDVVAKTHIESATSMLSGMGQRAIAARRSGTESGGVT